MTPDLLAVTSAGSPLWYLTRGTGLVALVLLTVSVVLGVASLSRASSPAWPRFLTAGLHRFVSLFVVLVLAAHILTAELDTFAPIGWAAVVVPFRSPYRPIWLGLGTLSFDLLAALALTSLLRERIGYRAWRAVHWLAYLCWPVAVVHGLGTGTDTRLSWVLGLSVACVAAVVVAAIWRLAQGWPADASTRVVLGALGAAALMVGAAWTVKGPMHTGWARRAGTPHTLLGARPAIPSESLGNRS